MIYIRATRALRKAGIYNIQIVKRVCGAVAESTLARNQTSRCHETWQKARDAVLDGYRPYVHEWKSGINVKESDNE